tara:strand:+ start:182 stop:1294 length:1113 start_codon:yes stop_codon:yes gene_type:complete
MALSQVGLERLNAATTKKIGLSKNLMINGACLIAQRGTSATTEGYLVDRMEVDFSGTDEAPTISQTDVASGTTPYTSGFRKAFKITNGNQTSGAGAADRLQLFCKQEAQNIVNSGWNYLSASSYITLSFWIKSSVAQNFFGFLRTRDGTEQRYPFETGSLSADTWTKITKTIPGNSSITMNNDAGEGLQVTVMAFMGTDYTDSGVSLNAWGAYAGGTQTPDHTSTWYTTNNATLEMTGFQLEVGSVATDFEHRPFDEELLRCMRYCYVDRGSEDFHAVAQGHYNGSTTGIVMLYTPVCMRVAPTVSTPVGTWITSGDAGGLSISSIAPADNIGGVNAFQIRATVSGAQSGEGFLLRTSSTGHTFILDSEL